MHAMSAASNFNINAEEYNILAAELHEATARCHREAARRHHGALTEEALVWATKAHIECNRAFNATIAAHKTSAGDYL